MPYDGNRVYLSQTSRDWLSQPNTGIDFKFEYSDVFNKLLRLFGETLLRSGLGRISTLSIAEDYPVTGGGHMMGTTRMGQAATDSVVDADCRVHGVDNLYVAGSSVFPAAGSVNPTFTIVALAVRLADHLSTRMKA